MPALLIALMIVTGGCASYQSKLAPAKQDLRNGQFTEAIEKLKLLADEPGDDQLVYLLDYGTALQIAGRYEESIKAFLAADKLAEIQDYHSVSRVAIATLSSEEMVQYKGEIYEKILINAYLAINFLMLGKYDSAMVEVRRINEKINRVRQVAREDYELNPFAHFLAALIYESDRKFDDAYISFKDSYEIDSSNPFLPGDLLRSSLRAQRSEEFKKWQSQFGQPAEQNWKDKNLGELVLIYQQGWGPVKGASPHNRRIPKLYPTSSLTSTAILKVQGQADLRTQPVYSIEQTAIKTMDADYGWMVARKVGSIIAKEIVADQIRQKNEALGIAAWLTMHLSDRADVRQWSTLPKSIQMARAWLKPGTYKIQIHGQDAMGNSTESTAETEVKIQPGRKTFVNWRSVR